MRACDYPVLADENIHTEVIQLLRSEGRDVRSVYEDGLGGAADIEVLAAAHAQERVVLTHDSDFGTLAIRQGVPVTGILHFRPGHISPEVVVSMWRALEEAPIEVESPFLVVVEIRQERVRVRVRNL
jgi:predicted nuclease of predicted toxin-antitoxin system